MKYLHLKAFNKVTETVDFVCEYVIEFNNIKYGFKAIFQVPIKCFSRIIFTHVFSFVFI